MIAKRASHRTRIGKRNQVTIPVALLRELGIGPGDQVEVSLDADRTIGIVKAEDPFERLRELRESMNRPRLSDEEFELAIEEGKQLRMREASAKYERVLRESRDSDS